MQLSEAIQQLKTQKEGIPFDVIEYLYQQPTTKELLNEIIFSLEHAYDVDVYYDAENDIYLNTSLWFAIVAENHIDKSLLDPVINWFISYPETSDILNEQGQYLLDLLAEKYPEYTIDIVMQTIDKQMKQKSEMPYLYLFDVFYYITSDAHKQWLLKTLRNKRLYWRESLIPIVCDLKIEEVIPIIVSLLKNKKTSPFEKRELLFSLNEIKTGINDYSEQSCPYSKQRKHWKEHYKGFEDVFSEEESDDAFERALPLKEVGRNDPCPCGSNKKYKKCCLPKHQEQSDKLFNESYIMSHASDYPLDQCLIGKSWKRDGIALIFISRKILQTGLYIYAGLTVDLLCMGVRESFSQTGVNMEAIKDIIISAPVKFVPIDYQYCRGLILGAIDFAKQNGFSTSSEWENISSFFAPNEPYQTDYVFGDQGIPHYVQGPSDNVSKIIKKLALLGEQNIDYFCTLE